MDAALKSLREESLDVEGVTCHVGKKSDRAKLLEAVSLIYTNPLLENISLV